LRTVVTRHTPFDHLHRCTSCNGHAQARRNADATLHHGAVVDFGLEATVSFYDDWAVQAAWGTVRGQDGPTKPRSSVLQADKSWEGYTFGFYGTVLYEPHRAPSQGGDGYRIIK